MLKCGGAAISEERFDNCSRTGVGTKSGLESWLEHENHILTTLNL